MTGRIELENGHRDASMEEGRSQRTFLKPWQEIVGNLELVSFEGPFLEVHLTTKSGLVRLSLERNSPEAERIHDILLDCPTGSTVGLLKTDSRSNPVLIRKIEE